MRARQGRTRGKGRQSSATSRGQVLALLALIALLVGGGWYAFGRSSASPGADHAHSDAASAIAHRHGGLVELPHIHGMGYTADGRQLQVAAHIGLRVYAGGEWLEPDVPMHDYMGFTPIDNGFYSSGHPELRSTLSNPLGLVKSVDGGATLTTLGFEGESDFHLMAAGYSSHALYVFNPVENSRLSAGLHYSLDDGATWQPSALTGITAQPLQLAVHPTDPATVALATEDGLMFSNDYGNSFERIGEPGVVTAVTFTPAGEALYFGAQLLYRYDLASSAQTTVAAPPLSAQDAIAHLAINPIQDAEIALATLGRDIYLSQSGGATWQLLIQAGKEP